MIKIFKIGVKRMKKDFKLRALKSKHQHIKKFHQGFPIILGVCLISLMGILKQINFRELITSMMKLISDEFGILYLVSMNLFIVFSFILALSKLGTIKLGSEDTKPEYTFGAWFAMLFGAGMGIGLVFWGVAEPIFHFTSPLGNIKEGSIEAANFAFVTSFMHWGIHPWASYSIVGLAIAYFQFRKGKPSLVSSIFIPLIGEERASGLTGKMIDYFAVFATVAGVSASLGMGTMQINSGLNYMFHIPENIKVQLIIIILITFMFILSAVSGINKGISIISNVNLILAFGIMVSCFFIGPTKDIMENFSKGTLSYLRSFLGSSIQLQGLKDKSWLENWTIFYWAWWISWTPFVGMFIARISKGRTIREFVLGVIMAPTLASALWFSIFGTLGTNLGINKIITLEALKTIAASPEIAFFKIISYYPFHNIISIITMILLCTFFITSADSATFVLAMLTSKGSLNPSNKKKIFWGIIEALLAIILLISGGLSALQAMAIIAALPFVIIIIIGFISLCKELRKEKMN